MELPEQPRGLLQLFAAGELEAFETLFRQFQGDVYGWIVRIVRDPGTAEDLTIETFWRIHRAHARFDPQRGFGPWARRIATNVALDYLKSARAREKEWTENRSTEFEQHSRSPDPAIRQEMRERTQRAFQQLPASLQVVATLALIEELPHSEIAEALNLTTPAVKSRLFRAVRRLRRKLGDLE